MRVQLGLQLGFLSNFVADRGKRLGPARVVARHSFATGIASSCTRILRSAFACKTRKGNLVLFGKVRPELIPAFKLASWSAMRRLGQLACLIFVLYRSRSLLPTMSDNLIIAHIERP
jgi:hypothetical protein